MTLPESVTKTFNNAAATLVKMSEEIVTLEKKFGSSSPIVTGRKEQYSAMLAFYNSMREIVPQMFQGICMAAMNQEVLQTLECKHQLGVSWDRAQELLGIPPERIKQLKSIDAVIDRINGSLVAQA